MARLFDGTNDNITFGSDASVDGFATKSFSFWVRRGATNARQFCIGKDANTSAWAAGFGQTSGDTDRFRFIQGWTGFGLWFSTTQFTSTTALNHIAVTYDGGSTSNVPVMYVNGTSESVTTDTAPTGTITSDSGDTLRIGEDSGATQDLNGDLMCLCYYSGILTAEQVNRARWWGTPGGGVAVYHPFFTDKLTNEGTATANGTASGTTVGAMACPVVRPGTAMMGMGIGW